VECVAVAPATLVNVYGQIVSKFYGGNLTANFIAKP
jgi:hypothetical protein